MFLWGKEFICFEVESEILYNNFKKYFDALWEQKVRTYEGREAVERVYDSLIDSAKPEDDIVLFAAKPETKRGADYNVKWVREIRKKAKNVRLLYYGDNEENRKRAKEIKAPGCETRIIATKQTLPISTVVVGNTVLNSVWEKNPITFKIENKTVADSLRNNFDLLWDQDTRVLKGIDAIEGLFDEMLEAGQCDFIAARGYFVDKRPKYIDEWEKRAVKKGFKMRNIVDPETKGHRITKFPFVETKYTIPKEFAKFSVIWIFGNKVAISNWTEEEPIVVVIENKSLHKMYKLQFETLWKLKKLS